MSNVNKPVIPAEVADAIEKVRGILGADNTEGLLRVVLDEKVFNGPSIVTLRSIPFTTILTALVNGYECEITEEQARKQMRAEIARTHQRHSEGTGRYDTFPEDYAFADGIKYTLDMLGIDVLEQS
ncbi:hypothetical protein ABH897_003485 [Paenibacillus sp. RC73]|uniref:hypothetical protein n=1 Tax=Paenibacillus sp. RC73 TaxID=3156250 RepID=UPI0038366B33